VIWLEVVLLAVVQGIGEFLPISSSGHVVVGLALFEWFEVPIEEKLAVNVVLHLGTLGAILVFYWRRIWLLLGEDRRVIWLLIVGTLPAAVFGLAAGKSVDRRVVLSTDRRAADLERPACPRRAGHARAERSAGPVDRSVPGGSRVAGHLA